MPYTLEFSTEVMKILLANAPAAMEFAGRFGLSPGEVREIIHEALLHRDGSLAECDLPILAHPPEIFKNLSLAELSLLLGQYPYTKIN